jgi:hypothetical protein
VTPASIPGAAAPLRVGVAVEPPTMPAWGVALLPRLASRGITPVVVEAAAVQPARAGGASLGLYERIDRRLFSRHDASGGSLREVTAIPPDVRRVTAATAAAEPLDLVVWLGAGPPPAEVRQGAGRAWWLEHEPAPSQAFVDRSPVVETRLLEHRASDERPLVVDRVVGQASLLSAERARSDVGRTTLELVVRALGELLAGREPARPSRPGPSPAPSRSGGALRAVADVVRMGATGKSRSLRFRHRWSVAYRRRDDRAFPPSAAHGFSFIPAEAGREYADPFLVSAPEGRFVFFEDIASDTGRGAISRVELYPDGTLSPVMRVLERDYHLSYPLVFRTGDQWLMLPETAANRTIELYRAVSFPDSWELDRVLVENVRAVDTTPFEHDGRTWIFSSIGPADGAQTETLSLFWADSLTAEWHPHPLNPVIADVRSSRPAGRVIVRDGRLVRPAQDGSRGYGSALVFNEILELTTEGYRETEVARIEPTWHRRNLRTHHYDVDDAFEVIDAWLLVPRRGRGAQG